MSYDFAVSLIRLRIILKQKQTHIRDHFPFKKNISEARRVLAGLQISAHGKFNYFVMLENFKCSRLNINLEM